MRRSFPAVLALLLSACFTPALGQQVDSLSQKTKQIIQQIDSLFNTEESLSLFRLIDSIMQMPPAKEKSLMSFRLGYNSNVASSSRTLGLNQYGLSPGISYFHKTGLYADVSSYYSQVYTPDFYLTVLSGGYMKMVSRKYSFLVEYSRYLYTATGANTYIPYVNNVGASQFVTLKPFTFRLDYYFYFGQKRAHRIMPSLSFNLEKKKWHKLDKIQFYPTFTMLFGSEKVITDYVFYPDYVQRYDQNLTLPPDAQLPLYYPSYQTVFGVMNYALLFPVSITLRKTTLMIGYTYNMPRSLPHEDLGLKANGYLSCSLTQYIGF